VKPVRSYTSKCSTSFRMPQRNRISRRLQWVPLLSERRDRSRGIAWIYYRGSDQCCRYISYWFQLWCCYIDNFSRIKHS